MAPTKLLPNIGRIRRGRPMMSLVANLLMTSIGDQVRTVQANFRGYVEHFGYISNLPKMATDCTESCGSVLCRQRLTCAL